MRVRGRLLPYGAREFVPSLLQQGDDPAEGVGGVEVHAAGAVHRGDGDVDVGVAAAGDAVGVPAGPDEVLVLGQRQQVTGRAPRVRRRDVLGERLRLDVQDHVLGGVRHVAAGHVLLQVQGQPVPVGRDVEGVDVAVVEHQHLVRLGGHLLLLLHGEALRLPAVGRAAAGRGDGAGSAVVRAAAARAAAGTAVAPVIARRAAAGPVVRGDADGDRLGGGDDLVAVVVEPGLDLESVRLRRRLEAVARAGPGVARRLPRGIRVGAGEPVVVVQTGVGVLDGGQLHGVTRAVALGRAVHGQHRPDRVPAAVVVDADGDRLGTGDDLVLAVEQFGPDLPAVGIGGAGVGVAVPALGRRPRLRGRVPRVPVVVVELGRGIGHRRQLDRVAGVVVIGEPLDGQAARAGCRVLAVAHREGVGGGVAGEGGAGVRIGGRGPRGEGVLPGLGEGPLRVRVCRGLLPQGAREFVAPFLQQRGDGAEAAERVEVDAAGAVHRGDGDVDVGVAAAGDAVGVPAGPDEVLVLGQRQHVTGRTAGVLLGDAVDPGVLLHVQQHVLGSVPDVGAGHVLAEVEDEITVRDGDVERVDVPVIQHERIGRVRGASGAGRHGGGQQARHGMAPSRAYSGGHVGELLLLLGALARLGRAGRDCRPDRSVVLGGERRDGRGATPTRRIETIIVAIKMAGALSPRLFSLFSCRSLVPVPLSVRWRVGQREPPVEG